MSRLKKNYTNSSAITSFSGLPIVLNANKHTTAAAVRNELQKIPTWNLFRPIRNKYTMRKYRVFFVGYQLSVDLADFSSLSEYNRGFKHCLGAIDVFSKVNFV